MRNFYLLLFLFILISCGANKRNNSNHFIEVGNLNYVEIKNEKGKIRVYEIVYPEGNDYGLKIFFKGEKRIYKNTDLNVYQEVKMIVETAIKTKQAKLQLERIKHHILIFDNGNYSFYLPNTLSEEELNKIYSLISPK
ncbi:hypothetical protein [Moheibacter lacus]|uniref:Uncharacterized protein n=1 Tax=Moheibacter lacus TaxID=2745851 RepID=A0A838ZT86_9FLAO|nr:hypothetical protein [Moheibacter lacus]MBA5630182.1 hypothetical protein [Moheibacter lacus]